ncbi:MAG TPA: hypothetical protein VGR50_01405 [Terriglobales bacterium]|nr:hypothetical protein [Terriglobales bacterium]
MVKPTLRTKSLGTKVTEEEYVRLAGLAEGRSLSEWAREVLLRAASEAPHRHADEVLLAEVIGLRTILLNVLYRLVNGEKLTAQEMQQLIERADGEKQKKAVEKLASQKAAAR